MKHDGLTDNLLNLNELSNVVCGIIEEYEHDLVKEKMAKVFSQLSEQAEFEKTLESIESDIHLCRNLARRVVEYCEKRRDELYGIRSTK
mgnify:CR=1 FL=1